MRKFCEQTGEKQGAVRAKILTDALFRRFFLKDPIRQNAHELYAASFIEGINSATNFKKLGSNETFIISGGIVKKSDLGTMKPRSKSVDFYWECGNKKFYAFHKCARDSGGHQDNQYRDLRIFIEEANKSGIPDAYFTAIADGDYYGTNSGKAQTAKIGRLRQPADGQSVFAMTGEDLPSFLDSLDC